MEILRRQNREGEPEVTPLVGIVMGSRSDAPVMSEAAKVLDVLEIPFEVRIISAHRTPKRVAEYAISAYQRGLEAIIAGAGGAAHLAGMIEAYTHLQVIGVPVRSEYLNSLDSLLSMVQMPKGRPVSVMGINMAENAGLTAASVVAASRKDVTERLIKYREEQSERVVQDDNQIGEGYRKFLEQMGGV